MNLSHLLFIFSVTVIDINNIEYILIIISAGGTSISGDSVSVDLAQCGSFGPTLSQTESNLSPPEATGAVHSKALRHSEGGLEACRGHKHLHVSTTKNLPFQF